MKLFIAWIKKRLGIKSPSTVILGYEYEYDYLKIERKRRMTDKEIVDYLIELTAGTIDHFDLDDAMDLLYEVKATLSRRAKHEE